MIIIGLNNNYVLNKLREKYLDDVYEEDIKFKEELIKFVCDKSDGEDIIITKDSLDGNMSKEIFIKQLRLANQACKIILLTENLDDAYKKFLYANKVYNIIEGTKIEIEKIIEALEEKKEPVYEKKQSLNTKAILQRHFIAIYGTSGSGKSYIASNLAKVLSKDIGMKVGVIDMDLQNPAMDIYNNLNLSASNLGDIVEDIDKGIDINDILDARVSETQVAYITNNSTIYECQNKLNPYYYEKIYAALNNRYDSIIVDLPASPFIDAVEYTMSIASKVYFVVNPNYISIRQALKYLELMTKLWQVPKSNIVIIINKYQKNSLDKYQIESFFSEYKILDFVNFSTSVEGFVNGINFNIDFGLNKEAVYNDLGMVEVKNKPQKLFNAVMKYAGSRMS